MLIVSTPNLENQKIKEYLGIVTGSTVMARNVGSDILANLKNLLDVAGGFNDPIFRKSISFNLYYFNNL